MRVSVICPVYNAPPDLLREAFASVLVHPPETIGELVAVDDASWKEETRAALASLAAEDPRVKVVRSEENGGPSRARNLGLHAATCEWISFLDGDDLWMPGGLDAVREAQARFPEFNWIAANTEIRQPHRCFPSRRLSEEVEGERLGPDLVRLGGDALTRKLIGGDWLHLGACFIRRESALRLPGLFADFRQSGDWLFIVRLSALEPILYLEREIYTYRRERPSLSTASNVRLTWHRIASTEAAMRDPLLRAHRRQVRWMLYRRAKGLAASNLALGRRLEALRFGLRALMVDPREVRDFLELLRLSLLRDQAEVVRGIGRYSTAAVFLADPAETAVHQKL